MKSIRDSNPGDPNVADPLDDLVRVVEGTSVRSPEAERPIYGGFEPVEVPQSQWDQFDYRPVGAALAPATAARASAPSLDASDRIEPLKAGAAVASQSSSASLSAEADLQIEDALRGLSQPARPRDTIPAETQSFAPARQTEHDHDAAQTITLDDFDELIASELATMQAPMIRGDEDDFALGFDDADVDFENGDYPDYPAAARSRLRRPLMLLGGVATFVLVGVAGAVIYAGIPSVGGGSDEPLLIKADAEPYKIAPVDPGGRSIPNQNKAVYQRVAGSMAPPAPTQQELVTAMEEPMDIAVEDAPAAEDLPGVMMGDDLPMPGDERDGGAGASDDRPGVEGQLVETATLQPRKVRTLTVRPDGTLVASDGAAASMGGSSLLTESSNTLGQASLLDPVAGIQPTMPFAADSPDLTTASTATAEPAEERPAAAPEPQPDVAAPVPVAEAPQQVASIEPEVPAAAVDGYFVQISSQPSQALAQQSMSNLGRRFASVIGSRGVGIKSADIPGKGTYYRVRVAAASKSEANTLCASLKSAGGSCFVTR